MYDLTMQSFFQGLTLGVIIGLVLGIITTALVFFFFERFKK